VKAAEIEIRFASPAAPEDAFVGVTVSPAALGLTVNLDYDGQRDLASFLVELHDGVNCAQLSQGAESEPVAVQAPSAIPAGIWFEGLLADHEYAVRARAYNAEGGERAAGCVAGLAAGEAVDLVLQDRPYDMAGVFAVQVLADNTAGNLEPAVQSLAAGLDQFVADVPGAILDAVRQGLTDPVTVDEFDGIRADQDLDGLLEQDFEDRAVDVGSNMEAIWDGVRESLAFIGLETRFEVGAAVAGVHSIYHTIEQLAFADTEDQYPVVLQDQGLGTAAISPEDPDLLEIAFHSVGLGLGKVLMHLAHVGIEAGWSASDIAEVLTAMVDCEAVTGVLADPLAGVADPLGIHAGCVDAMAAAAAALDERRTVIDSIYSQIGFAGSCRLEDPGSGDSVSSLVDGFFSMTWGGAQVLGPMDAPFGGQLQ